MKLGHNQKTSIQLQTHIKEWKDRGVNSIEFLSENQVKEFSGTTSYISGIVDHRSRTIHPVKYSLGLANTAFKLGSQIYENSEAIAIYPEEESYRVLTTAGEILAKKVIVATDAYSGSLFPSICQNYIPIGCFCYTSAPLSNEIYSRILPKCSGFYDSRNIMYFARKIEGNRILVGSLGYLPNQDPNIKSSFANRLFKKLFGFDPSFNWNNSWDGTIGYTTDNLPRFMEISKNVFSIFGYNGRGIAPGTYFGKYLADYICNKNCPEPLLKTTSQPIILRNFRAKFYESCFQLSRLIV